MKVTSKMKQDFSSKVTCIVSINFTIKINLINNFLNSRAQDIKKEYLATLD